MKNVFPPGWDEERVKRIIAYYENQSDDDALAEDEKAFQDQQHTSMEVPIELVPIVRELSAKHEKSKITVTSH